MRKLHDEVKNLKEEAAKSKFEERIEGMATQLNRHATDLKDFADASTRAPSSSGSSSSRYTGANDPAYGARTAAVLMHMLPPIPHGTVQSEAERAAKQAECLQRGKDVLLQCNVVQDSYTDLLALRNGKGCTLNFGSHAALQVARSRVGLAGLTFGNLLV